MLGRWIDGRSVPFRGTGGGKDPRRTNLKRHQLHDGVKLAGGILPDHVLDPGHPADGRRNGQQQRQQEHGLSAQLHDPTGQLPGALRTLVAVTVARVRVNL
jgi:hypothetical protein